MEGQVSNVDMLKAPSSFRRFMEATNRTKKQQAKREKQRLISQGLEVSDDEQDLVFTGLESLSADIAAEKARVEAGKAAGSSDEDEDEDLHTGPDKGDGEIQQDEDELDNVKKRKRKLDSAAEEDDEEDGKKMKRKYMSLRERKREARKAAKLAKLEDEAFMHGGKAAKVERSRGGEAGFGEIADAPPTITLKRKGGGKGSTTVPVAESGHKLAGGKAGNRQAQIFQDLMKTAQGKDSGKKAKKGSTAGVGLRRVAEIQALREQVIADYRQMRGKPQNNGRSATLASNPSRLFASMSSVGGATIRRDAGRL